MPPRLQLEGQRFGRLLVVASFGTAKNSGGQHVSAWLCRCDCSSEIIIRGYSLRGGYTKSCGCLNNELSIQRARERAKHGHARPHMITRTYTSWMAMHERCRNPKHRAWKHYGGRGIRVCERWSGDHGFENFLLDLQVRPAGKSLDRFPNNDGNYEPGNTRWATPKQQRWNQRPTKSQHTF
jgi:hypothetical protein